MPRPTPIKYRIVTAESLGELEEKVNARLAQTRGLLPWGGIYGESYVDREGDTRYLYAQVLVKH